MTGQAYKLDMDKLRKVRALMEGGKFDGERQAAKAKAEALAARAGMTLQAALSKLDGPSAQHANPFVDFGDGMEFNNSSWTVEEAVWRAEKEAQRLARCKELLAEYGSEDAVFAPTDLEAALRDALAPLADGVNTFWGYRDFNYRDGPTYAMWQAMRSAVRVPETVQEAWAAWTACEARTEARTAFCPEYKQWEWELAWESALTHLLDTLCIPTAEGIFARLEWMEALANQGFTRELDADRVLIASLQADFAAFVQTG